MQGIQWQDLRYFMELAHNGSLTAAAESMAVNATTVSRRISALESQLGVSLFDRSPRGWYITPVGETVLPAVERMADEVVGIAQVAQTDRHELSGKLRITASDVCIQGLLMPVLNEFSRRYPHIDIDLIATDDLLDLSVHDADIAFRATNQPPENVVGTHLVDFAYRIYAAESVYQRYRQDPASVGGICWTRNPTEIPDWLQQGFPGMNVRYRANSLNIAFNMVRQGLGFALLPCGLGDTSRRLVRIPCNFRPPSTGFWLLSHVDLRTTARIRIFRDFMLEAIQPYLPLIEGKCERYWASHANGEPGAPSQESVKNITE